MANHSPVKDTGVFFTIVPETRQVTVPQTHKVIGVVGDHLAEQLTFEIPRFIDGHDIEGCTRRYISWLNVDGEPGNDQLVELAELPEGAKEGMIYLTWTVRDLLAAIKGLVQFSLHFECLAEDGVTIKYHWGTTTCQNCEILGSVNHAIGVYAAIYVAEDTLIFSDYTPVKDGVLALETPGIVPEGTLEINAAGTYDVGKYAQARVVETFEEPTISVDGSTGMVTAEANGLQATHQLTGQDVSGVVGAKMVRVTINQVVGGSSAFSYDTYCTTAMYVDNNGFIRFVNQNLGSNSVVTVPQGSIITVAPRTTNNHIRVTAGTGTTVLHAYPAGVVQVTGEETASFTVTMT